MKLLLTDKPTGKVIIVDSDAIKLIENDGSNGTHLVFSENFGRVVVESPIVIGAAIGVVVPSDISE